MPAGANDPAAGLKIPEGYTVEQRECGRLAVYDADTGTWLGDFAPALDRAQDVVQDLITVHEDEVLYGEGPLDLSPEADRPVSGELSGDDARAAALRVRELERVAGLAVDALRAAGDEATAEIVRAVLEKEPERQ